MAIGARALRAGKAVIELSLLTGNVEKGLKKLERRLKDFGTALKSVGSKGMAVSGAIAAPFLAAIKAASDAQETLSRFKAVFGEQTAAATQFADSLAKEVGRAATDIKNGMASFQAFFVGLGFSAEKSRELSQQLSRLSLDFASFNNLADDDAQRRFISALSGSSEVLDMYGINIKVAALDQELLNMGFKGGALAATEQQKSIARLNIIMQSMTSQGAVGDATRTAGSFANMLKRVQGEIKTLAERIGKDVLPMATDYLRVVIELVNRVAKWHAQNRQLVTSIAAATAKLFAFSAGMWALGAAFSGVATAAKALAIVFAILTAHPIIAAMTLLAAGVVAVAVAFRDADTQAARFAKRLYKLSANPDFQRWLKGAVGAHSGFRGVVPKSGGTFTHPPVPHLGIPSMGGGGGAGMGRAMLDAIGRGIGGALGGVQDAKSGVRAAVGGVAIPFGLAAMQAQADTAVQRVAEAQRIEDDIARAKIMKIKDNGDRERRLIDHEHDLRLRALRESGMFTPEMKRKLEELRGIELGAVDGASAVGGQAAEGIFATRFASQIFGGRDEELDQLRKIARNTDPRNQQNIANQGIAVV